jgi:hypothetical protein
VSPVTSAAANDGRDLDSFTCRIFCGKPVSTFPENALALRDLTTEKSMSDEDLKGELERLRSENAALKKGTASGVRMKVSEKGAVSVYGMGRFPVTLYKEQWLRLLDMSNEIRSFIAANDAQLKAKD